MKKFILKSTIYMSVVLIYVGVGQFLLYRIRENIPVNTIVKNQINSPIESYYNKTLFENILSTYKLTSLEQKRATVITLGQSIVLCYRDFFFHPFEKEFYNTGLMIRNVNDIVYFKQLIIEDKIAKPQFIVFGLDHSLVMENSLLDHKKWIENPDADPSYDGKSQFRAMQEVLLRKDVRVVPDIDHGFGKRGMEGNGYRRDGSCNNKWEIDLFSTDSAHSEGILIETFKSRKGPFPPSMVISNEKKQLLYKTLDELRSMNIEIVVYVPPLSDEFFNYVNKDSVFHNFWKQFLTCQEELKAKKYDVIEFTTPSRIGFTDYNMLNSDHPGEILVAHQFYNYCISKDRKNTFIDKLDLVNFKKELDKANTHPISFMKDTLLYKNNK